VAAKAARAASSAAPDPQAAFERAGGPRAWAALLSSLGATPVPAGASPLACKAFTRTN
jgi:hypothetical protein